MLIKKGKTNWIFVAIVLVSAAVTGAYLVSYINSDVVQGAGDIAYPQPIIKK
jgi:hypothetical protein